MSTTEVIVTSTSQHWRVEITDGRHQWSADEPATHGGGDTGPSPGKLLCASLAACKTMTVQMYAEHKKWPLTGVRVTVAMNPRGKPQDGATELECAIALEGSLDAAQRQRLLEIADRCPTHRILSGEVRIASALA